MSLIVCRVQPAADLRAMFSVMLAILCGSHKVRNYSRGYKEEKQAFLRGSVSGHRAAAARRSRPSYPAGIEEGSESVSSRSDDDG